jgi:hypothetical protein
MRNRYFVTNSEAIIWKKNTFAVKIITCRTQLYWLFTTLMYLTKVTRLCFFLPSLSVSSSALNFCRWVLVCLANVFSFSITRRTRRMICKNAQDLTCSDGIWEIQNTVWAWLVEYLCVGISEETLGSETLVSRKGTKLIHAHYYLYVSDYNEIIIWSANRENIVGFD